MKLQDLQSIFYCLNQHEVRYLVVGGTAVVLHGVGRMTYDVDLVLDLTSENILKAFEALESLGYQPRVPVTAQQFADETCRKSWIEDKGMTVLNLTSEQMKLTPINLFVSAPFHFDETYQTSLEETVADGVPFRFVDLDTLITMKEKANREKDRLDIQQLRLNQQDPSE